jgi:hypothetical protein
MIFLCEDVSGLKVRILSTVHENDPNLNIERGISILFYFYFIFIFMV